jgi:hypothetical protein
MTTFPIVWTYLVARRCVQCAYPMTGLPDGHACPEYGTPYVPKILLDCLCRVLNSVPHQGLTGMYAIGDVSTNMGSDDSAPEK